MITWLMVAVAVVVAAVLFWRVRQSPERKQAQWAQWEQEALAGNEESAYKLLMLYYEEPSSRCHALALSGPWRWHKTRKTPVFYCKWGKCTKTDTALPKIYTRP